MSTSGRRAVRRGVALAAAAAAALAAGMAGSARQEPAPGQQTPTFRAAASAVAVDVTVRDRSRRAITGLTAGDFEVFDNGVLQQVDEASYAKLPIDVTVALDVSYSVTGRLLDDLRRGVTQLMRDLGPDDRLKLILFNMRVTRTVDFTNDVDAVERAMRGAAAGGGTALLDAISVALVSASAPDRRQLIVFFTDGSDSVSATTPAVLTSVAQRTRATLTFVTPAATTTMVSVPANASGARAGMAITTGRAGGNPLFAVLAAETGGAVLPAGSNTNLTSTFRRILADFRSAYVLYYNAQGVERSGYHAIEVRVKRENATVVARRGYFGS
jgi:VWFA-related protein